MKFYYNGKLVRTSKTHEYHFGVYNPDTGHMISCHGTREGAEKEYRRMISAQEGCIANYNRAIKALENGKTYYEAKEGNRWIYVSLKGKTWDGEEYGNPDTWRRWTESAMRRIEELSRRQIVELEARA